MKLSDSFASGAATVASLQTTPIFLNRAYRSKRLLSHDAEPAFLNCTPSRHLNDMILGDVDARNFHESIVQLRIERFPGRSEGFETVFWSERR